jgi:hypothetical protein
MITTEYLAGCSDEQINHGVAWLECKKLSFSEDCQVRSYKDNLISLDGEFDFVPCQNPNDIMPIAFANKISIGPALTNEWVARLNGFICYNTNPLRAICEAYILMSVAK